ncbi:type I restriction-modification system subunit M N-terminal domain-containing protein [Corynebacterium striatum]|uniref:type I restriction-modification system subunit M N-terminal domain-containing protein n=1 Tax=Corynebacterium striatum TaxID=43770 RepID=UPI0032B7D4E6
MAVKKTELYSLLWEAANKLRGGVEPARYKDYVLTLLFSSTYPTATRGNASATSPSARERLLMTCPKPKARKTLVSASIKSSPRS